MKTSPPANAIAESSPERTSTLSHGRSLEVAIDGSGVDRIVVRSRTGELELAVEIGPNGPRLRVQAVDIELNATRRLDISCETLQVHARRSIEIAAEEQLKLAGGDVDVRAPSGEISLTANDDIAARGERILLNSDAPPLPLTWAEFHKRQAR